MTKYLQAVKIYLDLCVYNRPFDDQCQPIIAVETHEFIFILAKAISKEITLVNSFILEEENNNSPYSYRRDKINDILKVASKYIGYSDEIKDRAKEIEKLGIMAMDALHIACAEKANCDYFVTCDNLLVIKSKSYKDKIKVNVFPLINFITTEVFNK